MRSRHRLPIEALAPSLLPDVPRGEIGASIDWPALFGNRNPVEIEVGFGKGLFILNAAASRPDTNFFGIEIVRKYQLHTATRLVSEKLDNVKLACADASALLRDRVLPNSIQAMHVYFPDPWWKKRHHKRRLFTAEFAAIVGRVLQPAGVFHIVTDVAEYHDIVLGIMNQIPLFRAVPPPAPTEPKNDSDYLTNFERKFRKEGRPIYRTAFIKTVLASGVASAPREFEAAGR